MDEIISAQVINEDGFLLTVSDGSEIRFGTTNSSQTTAQFFCEEVLGALIVKASIDYRKGIYSLEYLTTDNRERRMTFYL